MKLFYTNAKSCYAALVKSADTFGGIQKNHIRPPFRGRSRPQSARSVASVPYLAGRMG